MSGTELLAREVLVPLTRRSDGRGLLQLGSHLLALALTASLISITQGSLWVWPAMFLHGMVLSFLFAACHECIHLTAFKRRWINQGVATGGGFLLVLPPGYFRVFHLAHHRHTQDPLNDPELATPKPSTRWGYVWHISGIPYWRSQLGGLWRRARGVVDEPFVTPGERPKLIREARTFCAAYGVVLLASLLTGSSLALLYWVIPALLGQPMLRLYLLAEHTDCPEVPDMLANTRTVLTWPVVRWLAWNMPYHVEHHAAAAVPFHALPALHRLIRERIQVLSPGYVAFHRQRWQTIR